jgi:hypothetical protein
MEIRAFPSSTTSRPLGPLYVPGFQECRVRPFMPSTSIYSSQLVMDNLLNFFLSIQSFLQLPDETWSLTRHPKREYVMTSDETEAGYAEEQPAKG